MIGASSPSAVCESSAACFICARFAAFALAICSRRAAEDLRADGGDPGSADSPVKDVALEGIVPSQEAVEVEFTEPRRLALCKEALLSAGRDGFLSIPGPEAFELPGRRARGLGADFGVGIVVLPGLGLLASLAKGGGLDAPALELGVVLITVSDRFRGVPSMVASGAKLPTEALKFGKP